MEHPIPSPVDAAASTRRINVADLVVSLVLILALFATCLVAYLGLMVGSTPFRWASPPVIATVALIATILALVWRRIAFWIPLAGIGAIWVTQFIGTMLAGAGRA